MGCPNVARPAYLPPAMSPLKHLLLLQETLRVFTCSRIRAGKASSWFDHLVDDISGIHGVLSCSMAKSSRAKDKHEVTTNE